MKSKLKQYLQGLESNLGRGCPRCNAGGAITIVRVWGKG